MVYIHDLNPVMIELGIFEIRWYGLMYVIGFILTYFFMKELAKRRHIKISKEQISDYLVWGAVGMIVGARIFYILFYNLNYFMSNPSTIFAVWEGGLSFHGGLLGFIVGTYFYCHKYKKNFLKLADINVIPIGIALAFGRLGNFINGELGGNPTSLPWAVDFGDKIPRHPSQIYEAIYSLIIFATIWIKKEKQKFEGQLFALFLILYPILRFTTGFFRAPDSQLGYIIYNLTMGQLLNIALLIIGIYTYNKLKSRGLARKLILPD